LSLFLSALIAAWSHGDIQRFSAQFLGAQSNDYSACLLSWLR